MSASVEEVARIAGRLTKAQASILRNWYRPFVQNNRDFISSSTWTRGRGWTIAGLQACERKGLIESCPDITLHPKGWRHDITDLGRQVRRHLEVNR